MEDICQNPALNGVVEAAVRLSAQKPPGPAVVDLAVHPEGIEKIRAIYGDITVDPGVHVAALSPEDSQMSGELLNYGFMYGQYSITKRTRYQNTDKRSVRIWFERRMDELDKQHEECMRGQLLMYP